MKKFTNKGPFLWVALDGLFESENKTLDTAFELHDLEESFGFKANLDWLLKRGAHEARSLLPDRPIFVDTKAWNGARTMAKMFNILEDEGYDATNAYALAGGHNDEQGNELKKAIAAFHRDTGENRRLHIYAVTILTHYSDEYCLRWFGTNLEKTVAHLVFEGIDAGADGVIIPGTTLSAISRCYRGIKVIPGIRHSGHSDDHQKQVTKPEDLAGRPDIEAVVGGPIMHTLDPKEELKKMLKILQG